MNHVQLSALPTEPTGSGGPTGTGGQTGTAVFGVQGFATPWRTFDYLEWSPGQGCGVDAMEELCEEGFIVLGGAVELAGVGVHFGLASPAVLLLGLGETPEIAAPAGARVLHIQVGLEGVDGESRSRAEAVDVDALTWRDAIHGGVGRIATRHIWGPGDFISTWTFLDHAVLEPKGSVGYHYHDALEECFVVLAGDGLMTVDDRTFAVGPGSITWQGIGQGHGIYNPREEPLEFLRLAVAEKDEAYTTVDLQDDLANREPV